MVRRRLRLGIALFGMLVLLGGLTAGCAETTLTPAGETGPSPSGMESGEPADGQTGSGTLEVRVTDAPPDYKVTSVVVTVSEVQVHRAVAEQEQVEGVSGNQTQQSTQQEGSGWTTIDLSEDALTFDLLTITGIERFLGTSEVAAGKYTQVRLVLDDVKVGLLGETEPRDATVPSKELKLVHPFDVVDGETTTIVFDFDAEKMVTVTGAGDVMVKPVVKLIVRQKGSGTGEGADEEPDNGDGPGSLSASCDDFTAEPHIIRELEVSAGDSFTVTLCSNASTGFQWSESASIGDGSVLSQTGHEFVAPKGKGGKEPAPGTAGKEVWTFQALQQGTTEVSMEYSQPWDGGLKGEWTFTLTLVVK